MAYDFPASPTIGQEFTSGSVTYVFNGTGWAIKGANADDLASKTYVDAQDALKVAKAGDVMTGDLGINKVNPAVILRKTATSGQGSYIQGNVNTNARWQIHLGSGSAETGSGNAGSDFVINRFNDAGAFIDAPLTILRSTGQVLVNSVPAAPLDALAYNGMQTNGSVEINQWSPAGLDLANISGYLCDGWYAQGATGITLRYLINTFFIGFDGVIYMTVETPFTPAAGTFAGLANNIEGYRTSRLSWGTLNAKPITIGFWTSHFRPGLYSVAVRNNDGTRSYVASYTHNLSNVAEYKTITVPGCTDGAWQHTTAVGIRIDFNIVCGATFTTASTNTWLAGNFLAAAGHVNGAGATSDIFRIGGLIVIPGVQAPTAAQSPLIARPFEQELLLCKRYWQKSYNYPIPPGFNVGSGVGVAFFTTTGQPTGGLSVTVPLPHQMRVQPTINTYDNVGTSGKSSAFVSGAWLNNQNGPVSYVFEKGFHVNMGIANATHVNFDWTAEARM